MQGAFVIPHHVICYVCGSRFQAATPPSFYHFHPETMVNAAWKFLKPLYTNPPKDRLHVTLTYAQSLDGLIAGPSGQQITLSSNESMTMTHK